MLKHHRQEIKLPARPEDVIPVVQVQGNEVHVLLGGISIVLDQHKREKLIKDLTKAHKEIGETNE